MEGREHGRVGKMVVLGMRALISSRVFISIAFSGIYRGGERGVGVVAVVQCSVAVHECSQVCAAPHTCLTRCPKRRVVAPRPA